MPLDDELEKLERLERETALNEMMQQCLGNMPMFARLYWEAFSALKEAGFAETLAMEIVCTKGWNLSE